MAEKTAWDWRRGVLREVVVEDKNVTTEANLEASGGGESGAVAVEYKNVTTEAKMGTDVTEVVVTEIVETSAGEVDGGRDLSAIQPNSCDAGFGSCRRMRGGPSRRRSWRGGRCCGRLSSAFRAELGGAEGALGGVTDRGACGGQLLVLSC